MSCKSPNCDDKSQPPILEDPDLSLDGENRICCHNKTEILGDNNDLNGNIKCYNYEKLCSNLQIPHPFPDVVRPEELGYDVNPPIDMQMYQVGVYPPLPCDPLPTAGKVALVVGGMKNIGRAVAERLFNEGYQVIATSRHPKNYSVATTYKVSKTPLDVRKSRSVKHFFEKVIEPIGKVDVLVIMPAMPWFGPLSNATGGDLRRSFEVNLFGYQRVVNAALPFMRHCNDTRVISLSPLECSESFFLPFQGGYSLAKGILTKWNDMLMVEDRLLRATNTVQYGPMFTVLEPGYIKSTLGLYEFSKPSGVASDNSFVQAQYVSQAAEQALGSSTDLVTEAIFRIAVSPQPSVRYLAVDQNDVIPGTDIPIWFISLISNLLPPDINAMMLVIGVEGFIMGMLPDLQAFLQQTYCVNCSPSINPSVIKPSVIKPSAKLTASLKTFVDGQIEKFGLKK